MKYGAEVARISSHTVSLCTKVLSADEERQLFSHNLLKRQSSCQTFWIYNDGFYCAIMSNLRRNVFVLTLELVRKSVIVATPLSIVYE